MRVKFPILSALQEPSKPLERTKYSAARIGSLAAVFTALFVVIFSTVKNTPVDHIILFELLSFGYGAKIWSKYLEQKREQK